MRVIAGTAKSLPLRTIEGLATRPTTDRIKETLFNMLGSYLPDCRFLDLFAGSGGIGIEALSRGADCAFFVENSRAALSCIRYNLNFTHLSDRARVIEGDVLSVIRRLSDENEGAFDIVFMDPPYDKQWERRAVEILVETKLIHEDTLIISEASLGTDFSWADGLGLEIVKDKRYKTNKHVWMRKGRG